MSIYNDLVLLTEIQLKPEVEGIQAISNQIKIWENSKLDNLLGIVGGYGFPRDGIKYISALIILKAEEEAPIGYSKAVEIINRFFEFCKLVKIQPKELFSTIESLLITDIMQCEEIEEIFNWGKLLINLKIEGIDIANLLKVLDISYSPLIFKLAKSDSKDDILYGLKCIVRANKINLDSTGAMQAIVGNSFSWIEENNDYYNMNAFQGIVTQPDSETTKNINGFLELLDIKDEDMNNTKQVFFQQYHSNAIIVKYPENEIEEDESEFDESSTNDVIKNLNEIQISSDPFKATQNQEKNTTTSLYKGKIKKDNTEIAIKKIHTDNFADLAKYEKEVKIMRQLSGKKNCFLRFYGSFIVGNDLYIIMEYVKDNLMEILTNAQLNELQMIQIAKALIQGFTYMATKNIYHRDIKPHNILITSEKVPKIIDFGITYFSEDAIVANTSSISNVNFIQGTVGYMSPEQKIAFEENKKRGNFTKFNLQKSDVFSLGITFFQMVSKKDTSKYENSAANIELQQEVSKYGPDILKKVIKVMVEGDPSRRANFAELLALIDGQTITVVR